MKKILIIVNGEFIGKKILNRYVTDIDTYEIIAIDGGANLCLKYDLYPDYIIGDIDSVKKKNLYRFKKSELVFRKNQEYTDFEKTLQFVKKLSPDSIKILSMSGKRTDHFMGNMIALDNFQYDKPIMIYDKLGKMIILNPGKHVIRGKSGQIFSLFAFRTLKGLTLQNCKYEINNKNYEHQFLGISNEMTEKEFIVEFQQGKLFVYLVF